MVPSGATVKAEILGEVCVMALTGMKVGIGKLVLPIVAMVSQEVLVPTLQRKMLVRGSCVVVCAVA